MAAWRIYAAAVKTPEIIAQVINSPPIPDLPPHPNTPRPHHAFVYSFPCLNVITKRGESTTRTREHVEDEYKIRRERVAGPPGVNKKHVTSLGATMWLFEFSNNFIKRIHYITLFKIFIIRIRIRINNLRKKKRKLEKKEN